MQLSSLLPLWEKVARTKSVPDEGALSIDRSQPLTRLAFAPLIRATLSRKGRGEEGLSRAHRARRTNQRLTCPAPSAKIFPFSFCPNHFQSFAIPSHLRGVS